MQGHLLNRGMASILIMEVKGKGSSLLNIWFQGSPQPREPAQEAV
jgi:hypothetical protein